MLTCFHFEQRIRGVEALGMTGKAALHHACLLDRSLNLQFAASANC
jgi:hypothetical protein